MSLGFFQERYDLLALNAWKAIKKIFNRIASLQMIEQTLDRHAGTFENRLAAENFWVLHDHFAHALKLAEIILAGETCAY